MPDDQLDMLYEKITKVKTLRGRRFGEGSRPESSISMSQVDDMWSEFGRPVASSEILTDDTSLDQNGNAEDAGSANTHIREMQGQLEAQRIEFEERLQAIGEGGTGEAEDLKVEKEHMEKQLVAVQAQMKRLLEMRGRGKIDEDFVPFEPVVYTARQLRIIRKVLDKWRAHRAFSMAETVLSNAVALKEANIIRLAVGNPRRRCVLRVAVLSSRKMFSIISPSLLVALWLPQLQHWILSPTWVNSEMSLTLC